MSKVDGEYELVLGNRQLLSAFFIIVILFGVFFTMGYVVGRNSGAPSTANAPQASPSTATAATNTKPDAAGPANSALSQPAQPSSSAPAGETKRVPVETKAVDAGQKTGAAPPAEAASQPKRELPPAADRTPASTPADGGAGVPAITPGPGRMYLQVAAAAQPQAGVVVDALKQKGFPALLAQGPNPTLFRVLVGPYADAAQLGKAKAGLESAGFRPMVRR